MSVLDTAKSVRLSVVEKLMRQRFVFHHVPKCGGTSVGRALRKRYILSQGTVTPEESYRALEAFRRGGEQQELLIEVLDLREQMLLYLLFSDVRCISLHVRFSEAAYERFSHSYKFITMLRDPVERFISHYNWSFKKTAAHACIEEQFEEFVYSPRAERMGATYVEYFAGLPKDANIRSQESCAAAISNLSKFAIVGQLGDTKGFQNAVKRELGVRIRVGHENKGRRSGAFKVLESPTIRARVEALCEPDLRVWDAVVGGL